MRPHDPRYQAYDLAKKWERSLRSPLQFGSISLWDVIAPYLVLYRMCRYISRGGTPQPLKGISLLKSIIRPYIGPLLSLWKDPALRRSKICRNFEANLQDQSILFLNFQPMFFRETFKEAADFLEKQYHRGTLVLGETDLPESKNNHSAIHFTSILSFDSAQAQARTRHYLKRLKAAWPVLKKEITLVTTDQNHDYGPYLTHELHCLFRAELPQLIRRLVFAEEILTLIKPKLVVSPDDFDPRTRLYTLLAKTHNIPTLLLQQGLTAEDSMEWRFFSGDHLAVFGETFFEIMKAHGILPEQMSITGCPRFDLLTQPNGKQITQIKANLGIPPGKKMILLASQPTDPHALHKPETRKKMLRAVGQVATKIKDAFLVVKLHPSERISEVRSLVGEGKQIKFVEGKTDIRNLVMATDVLITFSSTSALQALIADKPVICLEFPGVTGKSIYTQKKVARVARSAEELDRDLRQLLPVSKEIDPEISLARDFFLKQFVFSADGQSAARVGQLASSMISQRSIH